jgi:DNA-binding winged helix-turn-helix (wHTH) protein
MRRPRCIGELRRALDSGREHRFIETFPAGATG